MASSPNPEKRWRPVESPSSVPGVYFDQPNPEPTWSWKLPAWMTADWPEADEVDEHAPWWPTLAICFLALMVVLVSLQPWNWH